MNEIILKLVHSHFFSSFFSLNRICSRKSSDSIKLVVNLISVIQIRNDHGSVVSKFSITANKRSYCEILL